MCEFFSGILTRQGELFFCEDDSHETILTRLGWPDDRPLETRGWVRVEMRPNGEAWGEMRVDETSVPAWFSDERERFVEVVMGAANRVRPARAPYDAVVREAWATYNAVEREAWAPYNAVVREAWATGNAVVREAWAPYDAVVRPAWATYNAVVREAWATYRDAIKTITGYVPAKE